MITPQRQVLNSIFSNRAAKANAILSTQKTKTNKLPLVNNSDFSTQKSYSIEGKLDLNDYLVHNPENTFLIRVSGDSMIKAGINSGDLLVVDRKASSSNGKVVVASINGELLVKRLKVSDDKTFLVSENELYPPIEIMSHDKFDIWGVVTSVVKSL